MASNTEIDRDIDPGAARSTVLLAARLTPHRSLSRTGFTVLMSLIGIVSFTAGAACCAMGAWPVLGFLGLDLLVIWWAFRVNFARARAFEEVDVSYDEVRVRRVDHHGRSLEWRFNPLWVRIDCEAHAEFGIEHLYLVSRGHRLGLASFLGADQKESFYKVLIGALNEARRGPTYNPVA